MSVNTKHLEQLLSHEEFEQFLELLAASDFHGKHVLRLDLPSKGLCILGLCDGRKLFGWFAAHAPNSFECDMAHAMILGGILAVRAAGPSAIAASTIDRARRRR